jgi:hypothetical protein
MKPPPHVNIPEGGTPAERLDMAFRKVLTVSKEALLQTEEAERRAKEERQAGREKNPAPLGRKTKIGSAPLLGSRAGFRKPGR